MTDTDTGRLLAASAEKIFADLCTPATLRASDLGGGAVAQAREAVGDSIAAAATYAAQGAARRMVQADAALLPLWAALAEAGLDRALATEADGGAGLGWSDVREMLEVAGRFAAPVPLADTTAACALLRSAGVSLPAGAGVLGLAHRDGDRIVAQGVAHASQARWVACTMAQGEGTGHRLSVFPVSCAQVDAGVGISGEQRSRLSWAAGDAIAAASLPPGIDALLAGAAVRVAQIAGGCARVVDLATSYANTREQFGRPIGKFQAIQQQLAQAGSWSAMAAMGSRLALSGNGVALDASRVAVAKQVAGTAVEVCTRVAHAVHGAIGITGEYDLQLFTRHLWNWGADFGSSLTWAGVIGRAVLAGRDERSWDDVIHLSRV